MTGEELAQRIVVCAEMIGHELSMNAARGMVGELVAHDPAAIVVALSRCTREMSGRLTLAAILERLPGQHLGPNEAWALCPRDEAATVVWTDEIQGAYGAAEPLLQEGDQIGARMAFLEAYKRAVGESRTAPRWSVSLGHDVNGRRAVLERAVTLGRLAPGHVATMLPPPEQPRLRALPSGDAPPANLRQLLGDLKARKRVAP